MPASKNKGGKSKGAKRNTGGQKSGQQGGAKAKAKTDSVTASLKTPVLATGASPVAEDPRALVSSIVTAVESESVEAEGEAETEGEVSTGDGAEEEGGEGESVEASAEIPPTGPGATPVVATPVVATPVEATPKPVEDPISRAVAAATKKGLSGAKVKLITTTKIAEFILAQVDTSDFLLLTQGQIKNTTSEVSPEMAAARATATAKAEAEAAAKLAKESKDKAHVEAEAKLVTRKAELATLIETEAAEAAEKCLARGMAFSSEMRSALEATFVIDNSALKSMADKNFVKKQSQLTAQWREHLRVKMITARYHTLRMVPAPPKGGPQPKGENLASLSKVMLKELFDAAIATPGMDVEAFEASGDAALLAQRRPSIDKWATHLGLKYNPESTTVGNLDGKRIHATVFRGTSLGQTLPTIREHTSTEIIKALFETGVDEMSRAHVSMDMPVIEGLGYKNPHRYWGKADAVLNYNVGTQSYARYDTQRYSAATIDNALKGAMTTFQTDVEEKVVDAMEKDGAI
jgi:hypothetical protein